MTRDWNAIFRARAARKAWQQEKARRHHAKALIALGVDPAFIRLRLYRDRLLKRITQLIDRVIGQRDFDAAIRAFYGPMVERLLSQRSALFTRLRRE